MCGLLDSLGSAVRALEGLPDPKGLGAEEVLAEQVEVLGGCLAALERILAGRMASWLAQAPNTADPCGQAVRAGVPRHLANRLRRLGRFADQHPAVAEAWQNGAATAEQVSILADGAGKLHSPEQRQSLVEAVLPHLGSLDPAGTRQLVSAAVDAIDPGDPDQQEAGDHAHRFLVWSAFRGGLSFTGYLPALEAGAFTAAIDALAEASRVEGDQVAPAQRRADALAQLVAIAAAHGLPTGGGLPAAVTLTIPLAEAERIAGRDPARHGTRHHTRPTGSSLIRGRPAGDAAVRFALCCAPLTPAAIAEAQPGSLLHKIGRTPVEPLVLGRAVRLASTAQRKALALRDGGCILPGCTIPAPYTQPHHTTPYHLGGPTDLDQLASLRLSHESRVRRADRRFAERIRCGCECAFWRCGPVVVDAAVGAGLAA